MTTFGEFKIEGSFKLRERGLIIYGDIVNGRVSKKNFLAFNNNGQEVKLQIDDINFIDRTSENTSKVGLTFYYANDEHNERLNALQVSNQTAKILED